MSLVYLNSVDPKNTRVVEDAFRVTVSPQKNPFSELLVASVLPPPMEEIDINALILESQQLRRKSQEETFHFLSKEQRIAKSFNQYSPTFALCAAYRMYSGKIVTGGLQLTESLEEATVLISEAYDHETFLRLPNFVITKENIEVFIWQSRDTQNAYQETRNDPPEKKLSLAELLIRGMLEMFNRTCSDYARDNQIPTLSMSREGDLTFRVHKKAKFNGPLRHARSFINLTNLISHLYGKTLPFTWRELRELGINFKLA